MKNKTKLILTIISIIIILAILVFVAILTDNGTISENISNVIAIPLTILIFVVCLYAGSLEYSTSVYECRKCKHVFKPTKSEYIWGLHSITTRYLKCPVCGKKSWCLRLSDPNA